MTQHYITTVTTFAPACEIVTATLDTELSTGERVSGAAVFGFYPIQRNDELVLWIEQEGSRINIPASAMPALIKQLKRSEKIARAMAATGAQK